MDPAKMKVVDLRSELGALGLDTKGNKPALVERLKKALEAKTGKAISDTTILDTSTEDADEPSTPRRVPAPRTTRRSSSSRVVATPIKPLQAVREDPPEPIEEDTKGSQQYSPSQEDSDGDSPDIKPAPAVVTPEKKPAPAVTPEKKVSPAVTPEKKATPAVTPEKKATPAVTPEKKATPAVTPEKKATPAETLEKKAIPAETPEKKAAPAVTPEKTPQPVPAPTQPEPVVIEDKSQSTKAEEPAEPMDTQEVVDVKADEPDQKQKEQAREQEPEEKMDEDADAKPEEANEKRYYEKTREQEEEDEEEEWRQLNERLEIREQERLERERKQADDDAKKLEAVSQTLKKEMKNKKDPVKLNRLKRKQQKKARWSNFYRTVEVTNELLTVPEELHATKEKKESVDNKAVEPIIDENKITLSWYDSDLNQYLEVPELNGVVPLSEGAFAFAWAGARATHGVEGGRVCYEVKVGSVVATNESLEKEVIASGLRIGWSTVDSSLHLGEGEHSWGYESTGRSVHNCEFKEYGKSLNEKDVVGAYLDLESNPCKISYTLNGVELGTAYEFDKAELQGKALFPHVLTKNQCYKVNFGNDRYNLLTKTKLVRQRIEIPVEQVLEEKRRIEEEMQRQKEEAAKKERERKEKEKKEREERQQKRREEREKAERERKEKENQARRERGEEVPEEEEDADKDKDNEKEKEDKEGEKPEEDVTMEEPKENGDKPEDISEKVEESIAEPEAESEVKGEKAVKEEEADAELEEITEEQVLNGQITLDKKIKFVIRYMVEEELDGTEACLLPGFVLIAHAELVDGPPRPAALADCEVILMVGMPGAGKTHWARQHAAELPARRYNMLSTAALFHNMKVDCKPFRSSYEGRWDAMVSKCAKCVLKLLEIAKGRRRNFILDQTNVYPSAQRRKLREFDGYRRVAVAIVTDDETYRDRHKRREEADGKEVPDPAIVDMKANFTLPEKCSWLDEVLYPELDAEAAKAVVEEYHKEARAAGCVRDKDKRERSAGRDQPAAKRRRDDKGRHGSSRDRDRNFGRDREDRWSSGGGSRWGGSGGSGGGGGGGGGGRGGSRWGPRDSRGPSAGPPQSRFDRPWQSHGGPPGGRGDFGGGRDRDGGFRGGRGGQRPERGGRGGGPPGNDRFGRDRPPRPNDRPDKRPHQPGGGNNMGGAGGWQRGAGPAPGRSNGPQRGGQQMNSQQRPGQKDGQNQNQNQQQQGWNQWAGGWGGWGNWNQNQAGWGNWANWGNWNPQAGGQQQGQQGQASGQAAGAGGAGGKGQQAQQQQQQQWPANYTAQQWYQWQQWQQQQQQAWPGYQQGSQTGNSQQEQAQAWAQYYQNYNANANSGNNAVTGGDKK